ncbi:MAG: Carboxyl-terminal protease [Microgenomates group bacterium GW2011_GWC1_37_12b]|uniref:Carboxyl-terminal protease n=1 Tax=Candidatus Woesebacteria bacterium GW2011_GWB1_38_8b TaxID=1618571 RepID=A0A0G0NMH5_9BACT|nr:MAG: Carboxyl-terminal protease [Microgenomates group bacterium GW2011_GWC1_37_12b]KKQ87084.1 MAG: Carboxyl-terminal protease [Candidatus Woesebacteria bacterium GW2011_GWB1_38_8b]
MQKAKYSKFKLVRNLLLFCLLFSFIFTGGYSIGRNGFIADFKSFPKATISRNVPPDKQNVDFELFWKVWDTLDLRYFDKSKLVPGKMVYGAISGMVAAVGDPYTVFLPPDGNKLVQEDLKGNFDGIGIQIGYIGTLLAVIAPLPGSPAEEAGVKPGDLIAVIKDAEKGIEVGTGGMSIPDAVGLIRGSAGTKVELTLLREGTKEPIKVEIVRKTIDVPSVTLEFKPGVSGGTDKSIAVIRVTKFGGETLSEWNEKVAEILNEADTKMIIVDVRNNPGGYLQGAVDLASEFLETGETVVIEENGKGEREESKVVRIGRLRNFKTVVLMNKGSASASEILAGALRDQKKIKLIGDTSFGKGTIQEPQQINGGSGLHITIAKWLTPKGTWVHEKGLEPDVKVEDKEDTKEDDQLQTAIDEVQKL